MPLVTGSRERVPTPDGDFLDLDWATPYQGGRLAILTHGLEGHSRGAYTQGMARALLRAGWDVLAWNFRGCSGCPNLKLQSYHSGATGDLVNVLHHVEQSRDYETVSLIGFSLGGNLMLKYLGETANNLDPRIQQAVAFSVPCDLKESAYQLETPANRIYMRRFLKSLRAKVREKMERFPGQIEDHDLDQIRTFAQFDDAYTAPIHGFKDAHDYWAQSSCKQYLEQITIPTLLVNAADDPFLTPACYPMDQAKQNPSLHLECPSHGGHIGFIQFNQSGDYWSEQRTVEFLAEH
ncbi:MAG: alpha/beta fold hydrolase [Verrucomicrobiota bacterium]